MLLVVKLGHAVASYPGHSQILAHGCEIKSGRGLGTRLGMQEVRRSLICCFTNTHRVCWQLGMGQASWRMGDNIMTTG